MSPAELAAVAAELEPDIRSADNAMREIASLQQRGVTGAGNLSGTLRNNTHVRQTNQKTTDNETLQPRLEALLSRHAEDLERAAALEKRVAKIVRQYALQVRFKFLTDAPMKNQPSSTQVDGLSELFVMWDEVLRTAEDGVTKLEKEREERSRRGYE